MNNSNKIYPALIAIFFITAVDTMLSLTLFVLVALGSLRLLSKQLATTTLYLTEIGIVFGIVLLIVRFFTIKRNLSRVPLTSLALIKDRKSTRLNSSHQIISYAVFCLKKKNKHMT